VSIEKNEDDKFTVEITLVVAKLAWLKKYKKGTVRFLKSRLLF